MFKSIQWKIVTMFVLLILSVITAIGSFLFINIAKFYNREFSSMMEQVFTEDFVEQLEKAAGAENDLSSLSGMISSYIGPLGIDTYRFYCILDAKTGEPLVTSDSIKSANLEKTDNIITAMTGKRGNIVNTERRYMDYAVCIKENDVPKYIIYVKDTKHELRSIMQNMFWIMIQALLLAVLIAVLVGYFLSRTITVPIINLTKRAERLAGGEFENMALSASDDEIGRLSNTFRFMSSALHDTIVEVNSEKTKVETILQNMTDGILAFNLDGKLIHVNPEAQRLLPLGNLDELEFNSFFKSINAGITMGDLLYIRQDGPIERQIAINDEQYIKLNFATFYMENKVGGIIVVIHDDTKQQKLELSRREFVANVSHELRTPLTTIKSYAETLIDNPDSDGDLQNRFLQVIVDEADRMTRIVKDLLTLSHLDYSRDSQKNTERIDVKLLIESIVDKMSINAKNKNQTLSYRPINDTPLFKGDRDRLEQVIVNIISNAIKYTPSGGNIEVYTGRVYNDIYIKVIDNGIGIPKENLPRIFERFYRVDKARSRDTGGTGLGLSIAKQIVDSFGGTITISSELNKGTEVIISLPA
ncbi:MAG: cell wall metabolism sensor histidine kinase WalK [Clostridia bacterium]|nr:cell wall metabolism sensor histidine kinase WalK [Clostridia bacterium]